MNNPIVVSTIAYDGYDLDTALKGFAHAGVQNVEIAYSEAYTAPVTENVFSPQEAERVCALLEANRLLCFCLAAHMDMSHPFSVEKFKRRIDFAVNLGARYIVSTTGPAANRETFMENIKVLGEYAGKSGLILCLENIGDGRPNIIDSAAPASALIREINLPNVRVNYDFANLLPHCSARLRPEEDYRSALPEIGYFHIKDVVRHPDGSWSFPAVGDGMIDYGKVMRDIAAHPAPIPLSLELSLRITRLSDATPVRADRAVALDKITAALRRSLDFVGSRLSG